MNLEKKVATRQSFGEALEKLGEENNNIVVLDCDLSSATKTNLFAKRFPDRFFNMGIAEQDMISTAAGFSTCNKIPFVATFAVFATGRAYEQIRNSVCYPKLNVKICGTHAGITVGEDGATHQMLEDISLMRSMPNMIIISPSDDVQTKWAVEEASKIKGPVYIRLNRMPTPIIYNENNKFELGKAIEFGKGTDAIVFATGDMVYQALKAKQELEENGIYITVVDIHTIKPIDKETIVKLAKKTNLLVSVEDHNVIGGLGTAISDVLTESYPKKLIKIGVRDCFGKSGKAEELLEEYGLTSDNIKAIIKSNL